MGDRQAGELEADDLTTGDRQDLSKLLGVKGRTEKKRPGGRRRGGKKAGRGSGSGVVEVDLEDDVMSD